MQDKEQFNDFLYNAAYLIFYILTLLYFMSNMIIYDIFYSDEILHILILVVDTMFLLTMLTFLYTITIVLIFIMSQALY